METNTNETSETIEINPEDADYVAPERIMVRSDRGMVEITTDGWTVMNPDVARKLASALNRAADAADAHYRANGRG